MNEEVKMYMDEAKEQMQNALVHLENELAKIRAGKANPKILNDVLVDYYGSPTPLSQVANITAPDPRTIAVQPWEKNMLGPIQKAIMNANLGFNPDNNGEVVRINVPPLTAERRKELVKQSKGVGETAKVSIRNARRDAIDEFKKSGTTFRIGVRSSVFPISASSMLINELSVLTEYSIRNVVF